jgi:hypothetical protein
MLVFVAVISCFIFIYLKQFKGETAVSSPCLHQGSGVVNEPIKLTSLLVRRAHTMWDDENSHKTIPKHRDFYFLQEELD